MGFRLFLCLLLCSSGGSCALSAQTVSDSVDHAVRLLSDLATAGDYEEARLEADFLRIWVQQNQLYFPATAIPLISDIYAYQQDENSATRFFNEVLGATRRNPSFRFQVDVLPHLIEACQQWGFTKEASIGLQLLLAAQDSLINQAVQVQSTALLARIDTLEQSQISEQSVQRQYVPLKRSMALPVAGTLVFLLLTFYLWHRKVVTKLHKRLARKELEQELQLLHPSEPMSEVGSATIPVFAQQEIKNIQTISPQLVRKAHPERTALLIESNRQLVLYFKSLLADRFEIETASTPGEGLQAASTLLPDLIVCDAALNGQSGIDLVRQIKLTERTNHIPVILLTDQEGKAGQLDALRAGADGWFGRPVLHQVFDQEITQLLNQQRQRQQAFGKALHLFYTENQIEVSDSFLATVIRLIDQQLNDPDFLADDLARRMKMDNTTFVKKLHALTGKDPGQLIREMRLEKAKALLEKRVAPPQTVADLVGFASSGTFALAFKDYFGENTLLLQLQGPGGQ
ncbi:MAG: response regulator transcription factor [Bacteroidetes bacterium]|nr:MAG: response regulator transcription factor [Bacteroidota bacterium]